ncbi:hypothetical protein Y032_0175g492 [Ancylostoma ceylanicum]|uniref:EGF-like domain-containing protein n=1 Tax=Ancylostoma ceylanicum TaxID=53326 RepID=A0A016SUN6_9BILA|nr:hypothetical protein Y032_0175g492 [Ancylostoma ceylanicum]
MFFVYPVFGKTSCSTYNPLGIQAFLAASVCNHGSLDENGECVCSNGYTGQFCDQPLCQNGGTNSLSVCVCTTGFYGSLCESQIPWYSSSSSPKTETTTVAHHSTTSGGAAAVLYYAPILAFVLLY